MERTGAEGREREKNQKRISRQFLLQGGFEGCFRASLVSQRIHLQCRRFRFSWVGSGGFPGEGSPLQYACLEATVHGIAKNWTQVSDEHSHFRHLLMCENGYTSKRA